MMARRCAFTLIELLVVIAIIAVLIAILLPSLSAMRTIGRDTGCTVNLKQISTAMVVYADTNHSGWYLASDSYSDDGLHYLFENDFLDIADAKVTVCPHTANVVDVEWKEVTYYDPDQQRFVTELSLRESHLSNNAENRHDDRGGHSYEVFSIFGRGKHVDGFEISERRQGGEVAELRGIRMTLRTVRQPDKAYIMLDADDDPDDKFPDSINNWPDAETNNHGGRGLVMGFLDGHAEFGDKERYVMASLFSYHPWFGSGGSNALRLAQSVVPEVRNTGGWEGHWWLEYD